MGTQNAGSIDALETGVASESAAKKKRATRSAKAVSETKPVRAAAKKAGAKASAEILFKTPANPEVTPIPPYIWIDYPQQNERLLGPVYNIRLGVGGADEVHISIDKSDWLACRLTSGYWWYDWSAIPAGKHVLVARMKTSDGQWYKTPPRTCEF